MQSDRAEQLARALETMPEGPSRDRFRIVLEQARAAVVEPVSTDALDEVRAELWAGQPTDPGTHQPTDPDRGQPAAPIETAVPPAPVETDAPKAKRRWRRG